MLTGPAGAPWPIVCRLHGYLGQRGLVRRGQQWVPAREQAPLLLTVTRPLHGQPGLDLLVWLAGPGQGDPERWDLPPYSQALACGRRGRYDAPEERFEQDFLEVTCPFLNLVGKPAALCRALLDGVVLPSFAATADPVGVFRDVVRVAAAYGLREEHELALDLGRRLMRRRRSRARVLFAAQRCGVALAG